MIADEQQRVLPHSNVRPTTDNSPSSASIKKTLKNCRTLFARNGKTVLASGSSLVLASCDGGGSGTSTTAIPPTEPDSGVSVGGTDGNNASGDSFNDQSTTDHDIGSQKAAARFLLRADLSISKATIAEVQKDGPAAWLSKKIRWQNDQTAREYFVTNGYDEIGDERRFFGFDRLTDRMIWDQLMRGGNGVRKRAALALSQFFVVSANDLNIIWPAQAMGAYWDILNKNAFGNFRNLLEEITLNPAMGSFLDVIGSKKANPSTGRVPDENFAREVMQLFTIGLHELHQDGTPKLRNGKPIETYSNEDVKGLAHVFTGFDLDASDLRFGRDPQNGRKVPEADIVRRPLTADSWKWLSPGNQSEHSTVAKSFLGKTIPAGTDAKKSIEFALDILFLHPNVGPFFAKQMIQRLVTSNPSPAYIAEVATAFNDNGRGERGDLATVFRTILLHPEANSNATLNDYRFGKLREPALRFVQFGRTFCIASDNSEGITRNLSDKDSLGQVPLRAPSVFNFYRPNYVTPQSVADQESLVAPEFQIVDEQSVIGYVNFMMKSIEDDNFWLNDWKPDYKEELAISGNTFDLVEHLDLLITAGQLRDHTKNVIVQAVDSITPNDSDFDRSTRRRVQTALMLTMISPDYLAQK